MLLLFKIFSTIIIEHNKLQLKKIWIKKSVNSSTEMYYHIMMKMSVYAGNQVVTQLCIQGPEYLSPKYLIFDLLLYITTGERINSW